MDLYYQANQLPDIFTSMSIIPFGKSGRSIMFWGKTEDQI